MNAQELAEAVQLAQRLALQCDETARELPEFKCTYVDHKLSRALLFLHSSREAAAREAAGRAVEECAAVCDSRSESIGLSDTRACLEAGKCAGAIRASRQAIVERAVDAERG